MGAKIRAEGARKRAAEALREAGHWHMRSKWKHTASLRSHRRALRRASMPDGVGLKSNAMCLQGAREHPAWCDPSTKHTDLESRGNADHVGRLIVRVDSTAPVSSGLPRVMDIQPRHSACLKRCHKPTNLRSEFVRLVSVARTLPSGESVPLAARTFECGEDISCRRWLQFLSWRVCRGCWR